MGTIPEAGAIGAALFGRTRRRILGLLFTRPERSYYLRELIRLAGVGQGAAQRELKQLVGAGIVERTERGSHVFFRASPHCPVFDELRGLVVKTSGVADALAAGLAGLANRVTAAFIYGSFAAGKAGEGSDVDVMVVGDVTFKEVVATFQDAQRRLAREVNPTVLPLAELRRRISAGDSFLKSVMAGPRILLLGDDDGLG